MTTHYDLLGLIGLLFVAAIVVLYRQWSNKQKIKKILKDTANKIQNPAIAEKISRMADEL